MQTGTKTRLDVCEGTQAVEARPFAMPHDRPALERLRLLWSARLLLKQAAIAGLFGGTLVAFLLPVKYESRTQLMPPDPQSTSGMAMLAALSARAGDLLGPVPGDLLGMRSSAALFIGVLNSRTIQDRLIERFDLRRRYGTKLAEDARKKLAENTGAFEDRKSGIITIAVSDSDRRRAAEMAQAYVDELNRLVAELSTSAARRERIFLEQRLAEVKKNLDEAAQRFSDFSSKNTAIDIKEQSRAMIEATAALSGQLIAAESELSGLEQIYNPNNVRVRSVKARIAELKSKISDLRGKDIERGSDDPAEFPTLRALPLIGVTYSDLYRQAKMQEAVYETLTQEYELAKVQEAKETPSVKVLDAPEVPERRSYPPRLQIMLAGILLGASSAGAWVLAKEKWRWVDEADPGKVFAEEVLVAVNRHMPWASPNGSSLQAVTHKVWNGFTNSHVLLRKRWPSTREKAGSRRTIQGAEQ